MNFNDFKYNSSKFSIALTTLLFIVAGFLIFQTYPNISKFQYSYEVGSPWQYETITAPFAFEIRKSKKQLQAEEDSLLAEFHNLYDFKENIANENINKIQDINSNFENEETFKHWVAHSTYTYNTAGWITYNKTDLTEQKHYQMPTEAIYIENTVKELTLSFDVRVRDKSVLANSMVVGYIRCFSNTTSTYQADVIAYKNVYIPSDYINDTWVRVKTTITVPSPCWVRVAPYVAQNGIVNYKKFKLEVGNVATDWSPSPKDTEEGLSVLETRVQTAESKITKDAIINTVSGTYVKQTDFNDAINQPVGATNRIPNSAPTSTSGWNIHTTGWSRSLVDCATAPQGKAMRASLGQTLSTGGMYKSSITTDTWEHGWNTPGPTISSSTSLTDIIPAVPPYSSMTMASGLPLFANMASRSSRVTVSGTNKASSIRPVSTSITPSMASGVRRNTGR